ncbi:MAG: MFS transporter [Planctomycetota bacterium]
MSIRVRLKIMMFLQFFVWGVFFVSLGEYLTQIFGGRYEDKINTIIGNIYATQTWAALAAPLVVGFVADRLFNKERVNGVLHLVGGSLLWWTSTISESWEQCYWLMLGFFICYMPTMALVNTITFQNVESPERDFPPIRLWGTIGWIVSGLIVAESFFGLFSLPVLPGVENAAATAVPLKLGAIASWIYGVYSFTLPASPPHGRGEPVNLAKVTGFESVELFKNFNYAMFAISSFLICIPLAFYYARTNDFVSRMSFGSDGPAVMALGQVSEIIFMALVPFFLGRLGVKKMLLVGMLAWAARYALFGLFPSTSAMLVLGILLHGICYDFFFVTGQLYTDRVAPPSMRTSAQALIGLLTYGAGMLIGNMIHGPWGDRLELDPSQQASWADNAASFWLLPAGIAFAVAIFFAVTFRDEEQTESQTSTETDPGSAAAPEPVA